MIKVDAIRISQNHADRVAERIFLEWKSCPKVMKSVEEVEEKNNYPTSMQKCNESTVQFKLISNL